MLYINPEDCIEEFLSDIELNARMSLILPKITERKP